MILLDLIKITNANFKVATIMDQDTLIYDANTEDLFYYNREDLIMRSEVTQIFHYPDHLKVYIK